jgi:hypothetical protein
MACACVCWMLSARARVVRSRVLTAAKPRRVWAMLRDVPLTGFLVRTGTRVNVCVLTSTVCSRQSPHDRPRGDDVDEALLVRHACAIALCAHVRCCSQDAAERAVGCLPCTTKLYFYHSQQVRVWRGVCTSPPTSRVPHRICCRGLSCLRRCYTTPRAVRTSTSSSPTQTRACCACGEGVRWCAHTTCVCARAVRYQARLIQSGCSHSPTSLIVTPG